MTAKKIAYNIRKQNGIEPDRASGDHATSALRTTKGTPIRNVVRGSHRLLSGAFRRRFDIISGVTDCPRRLIGGSRPLNQFDDEMLSRNVGIRTLSVLKIHATRNRIWCAMRLNALRRSIAVGDSSGMSFPERTAGEAVFGEVVNGANFYGLNRGSGVSVGRVRQR